MVKIFFTYYLISGGITMFYVQKKYDDMVKVLPIIEIVSKGLLLFIQFLFGFLIFPIAFPMHLKGMYLGFLIKRQEFRNRELKLTNELLDFLFKQKEQHIKDTKEGFCEEGIVPLVTFVYTKNKKIVMFPMSPETDEQYDKMISLIQEKCIEHNGVAVMRIGEAIEKMYDDKDNQTGEKDIILIIYEIKGKSHIIKMDINKEKKEIINTSEENGTELIFSDYLEQIYRRV